MQVEYSREELKFATILGKILEEKLRDKKKEEIARRINGSVSVECRDLKMSTTITFKGDRVIVESGSKGKYLISADLQTLNGLTFGKIGLLGTVKLIIKGKLKIKGMIFAMKFRELFR
ncbi:SCP2 sterol-binding domain-containing protein [Archaeoglobus neptunius]|uniref:SCP2 sterol-binding domain-containing protein n=1 Tax=Archaeoglobus neptunius TaxID=2798580 RepID=UPI0019278340|nr:SCP2 sterol-binding domain-containing protein [Archaeoglobus neptunius]